MRKTTNIDGTSGPAVFWQILWESSTNIAFFGFGMIIIIAIALYLSWWFALVLFLGFALVAVLSVLHQLVTSGANLVYLFSLVFGRGSGRGKAFYEYVFFSAANLVQLAEMGFIVVFTIILYQNLYP